MRTQLLSLVLVLFATAPVIPAQSLISVEGSSAVNGQEAAKAPPIPSDIYGLKSSPVLRLPSLPYESKRTLSGAEVVGKVRPLNAETAPEGEWTRLDDGRWLWRLTIQATGADALRIHFDSFDIGEGKLWVGADQQYTGQGRNGGDFWSGSVYGDTVRIEYAPADGLRTETLPFRIPALAHRWSSTGNGKVAELPASESRPSPLSLLAAETPNQVASCHLDVSCYADWKSVGSGVARLNFIIGFDMAACSGALISTHSASGRPLFLTANHCISDDVTAKTVEAAFFYETSTCNGAVPSIANATTVLGATYIVSGAIIDGDFSLIELASVPAKAYFFGWTIDDPGANAKVIGIHHPANSYKRIFFGTRRPDQPEYVISEDGEKLDYGPQTKYYQIEMTEGRVEPGSSGSPILNQNKQIVGTLTSGPQYSPYPVENEALLCKTYFAEVQYGRFSSAYPTLKPWLDDFRPGLVVSPSSGETLFQRKVTFLMTPGVGSTAYRLELGNSPGATDLLNRSFTRLEDTVLDGLPLDGRTIYGRFWSLVNGQWQFADLVYRMTQAAPQAATLIQPAPGSTLTATSLLFTWTKGVGASEYMIYAGSTEGGNEYASVNAGPNTSAIVSGLPADGSRISIRLFSKIAGKWQEVAYAFWAVDNRPKPVTLRFSNRLIHPVTISINGNVIGSIPGSSTRERVVASQPSMEVTYELVRPTWDNTLLSVGETIRGSLGTLTTPSGSIDFEINNQTSGVTYFAPVVSNSKAAELLLEANGVRCNCVLRPGASNQSLGYYRLTPSSDVRGYFVGYGGAFLSAPGLAAAVEPGSGAARVTLQ